MRVRARTIDWDSLPNQVVPYVSKSQTKISDLTEYEVHCVSAYKKVVFALIIDDSRNPAFVPAILFDIVDPTIPADWIFNLINDQEMDLVAGPPFIAQDLAAYNSMVDLENDSMTQLMARAASVD